MLKKMLSNGSNSRKGFSGNDFFPVKGLNFPSESKQRFFEAQENPGNDFSKNIGIHLKSFCFILLKI